MVRMQWGAKLVPVPSQLEVEPGCGGFKVERRCHLFPEQTCEPMLRSSRGSWLNPGIGCSSKLSYLG